MVVDFILLLWYVSLKLYKSGTFLMVWCNMSQKQILKVVIGMFPY